MIEIQRPDLQQLVTHYQQLLRLTDWRIRAEYVQNLRSGENEVWGLCLPVVDSKTARLAIRDPSTPPSGSSVEDAVTQIKETVVHELMHLWFAPFGARSPIEVAHEENAVWALSEALVKAEIGTDQEESLARAMVAKLRVMDRDLPVQTSPLEKIPGQNFTGVIDPGKGPIRLRAGESMDPKIIAAALDALVAGDEAKCAEILKSLIAAAAGGGGAAPAEATAEEEGAPAPKPEPAAEATVEEPGDKPMDQDQLKPESAPARRARTAEIEVYEKRARVAAESITRDAIRARVHSARVIDGLELPPSVEKRILSQRSLEEAETLLDTAREMLVSVKPKTRVAAPENTGGNEDISSLTGRERIAYQTLKESGREAQAAQYLQSALKIARARKAV